MAIINGYQSLDPNREAGRTVFQMLPSVIHALGIGQSQEHNVRNQNIRKLQIAAKTSAASASAAASASGGRTGGSGFGVKVKLSSQ